MASFGSSTLTTLSSVAISKDNYDTPVAKVELCLSTLHTWFCYNGLALNSNKSEAIVFGTTQHSNYIYCQCCRNPCPGFQSDQDSWRYPQQ